jgi:hypothetical protein
MKSKKFLAKQCERHWSRSSSRQIDHLLRVLHWTERACDSSPAASALSFIDASVRTRQQHG